MRADGSVGCQGQPASAVAAEQVARQQGLPADFSGHGAFLVGFIDTFRHQLLCQLEGVRINDLEFLEDFRVGFSAPKHSGIGDVVQDVSHGGLVPVLTLSRLEVLTADEIGDLAPAVSVVDAEVEHHTDDPCLFFVNCQLHDLVFSLVENPAGDQLVSVGCVSSPEAALLNHLAQSRLGADRRLLAFAVSLPVADVVGEAVRVRIESLFTLIDAPDMDALFDEPFNHERRLIGPSAQPVEHEDQKNLEFALFSVTLDLLEFIAVVGADLEAGDSGLLFLDHDLPAHLLCEVPAGFPLYRNVRLILVVMVHLFRRGYAV